MAKIIGIGTDLVSISRIREMYENHGQKFLQKICTEAEIKDIGHRNIVNFIAKRFAAKEAYVKALGKGISSDIGWQDIVIANTESGQPLFAEDTKYLNVYNAHLSISDEPNYVVAFVVLESKK